MAKNIPQEKNDNNSNEKTAQIGDKTGKLTWDPLCFVWKIEIKIKKIKNNIQNGIKTIKVNRQWEHTNIKYLM